LDTKSKKGGVSLNGEENLWAGTRGREKKGRQWLGGATILERRWLWELRVLREGTQDRAARKVARKKYARSNSTARGKCEEELGKQGEPGEKKSGNRKGLRGGGETGSRVSGSETREGGGEDFPKKAKSQNGVKYAKEALKPGFILTTPLSAGRKGEKLLRREKRRSKGRMETKKKKEWS